MAEGKAEPQLTQINQALAAWRQGDCVLGEQWFVHKMAPSLPITQSGRELAERSDTAELVEARVLGLVVVTQTCDIVRSCAERPYIEVCPLVAMDDSSLFQIERGRSPRYAYVPLLADRKLVADLDRTMTLEKPVVSMWERTCGFSTDQQARAFAAALARKRARFAFPDDFTAFVSKLHSRLTEKHDKQSPEGNALRALREVRVHADPGWDEAAVTLTFWFIRKDDDDRILNNSTSTTIVEDWLKLVPERERFTHVYGQIVALEDLKASDYVNSDRLDLDYLSSRK